MVKIEFKSATEAADITARTTRDRPVSPHIQIYKWEWTMLYSILHRAAAMGCMAIALLALILLISINTVPLVVYGVLWMLASVLGYPIWFAVFLTVAYFIYADIKYMLWADPDILELPQAKLYGNTTVVLAVITALGVLLWFTV